MVIGPGNLYVLILKLFDLTVVGNKENYNKRFSYLGSATTKTVTIQCSRERQKKKIMMVNAPEP
jgi:hypothetical protein